MATRKAATDAQPPRLARGYSPPRRAHGFTLIEAAVVLVVITLALGALLPLFTAQAANARISATRAHEDAIKAALITYLGRHGYLPCPADGYASNGSAGYGHEARSTFGLPAGACDQLSTGKTPTTEADYGSTGNFAIPSMSVYRGVLPWLDLGLPEEVVNDGWNQRISYVVSSLAVTGYSTREAASGLLGGLVICSDLNTATAVLLTPLTPVGGAAPSNAACIGPTSGTQPLISLQTAAAALISHGEDGYGAFMPPTTGAAGTVKPYGSASAQELANIDLGQNVLVSAPYSRNFDDIVLWLTPDSLTAPLIQSGALPSLQAVLSARFRQASQAVLSSMTVPSNMQTGSYTQGGVTTQGFQFWLCLAPDDASGNPIFGSYTNPFGDQLLASALPAGSVFGSNWQNWDFNYGGAGDLSDGDTVRNLALGSQLNYDPWGNPLLFTLTLATTATQYEVVTSTTPTPNSPTQPYAYVLYSVGPDGIPGTADDASLGVTVADLQNTLVRSYPVLPSQAAGSITTCVMPSGGGGGGGHHGGGG